MPFSGSSVSKMAAIRASLSPCHALFTQITSTYKVVWSHNIAEDFVWVAEEMNFQNRKIIAVTCATRSD